jgi:hypothetical protein
MPIYLMSNGPMVTTAGPASVTTGNTIKTMMQIKPGTTSLVRIIEWGISFDGYTGATPIKVELVETDVAATVTAYVANDICKVDSDALNSGDPTTNIISVGTSASGYTSTSEGSVTASRMLDQQLVSPTSQYLKQFPLGREPVIQPGKFLRIRVTAGTAVNAYCYVVVSA